jgi:hypothetical protein
MVRSHHRALRVRRVPDGRPDENVAKSVTGVHPSHVLASVVATATTKREKRMAAVSVSNDELHTVRDAMRELNRMVDALTRGDIEKVVLTQRNKMRVVMIPLDRFVEMERCATTCTAHGGPSSLAA